MSLLRNELGRVLVLLHLFNSVFCFLIATPCLRHSSLTPLQAVSSTRGEFVGVVASTSCVVLGAPGVASASWFETKPAAPLRRDLTAVVEADEFAKNLARDLRKGEKTDTCRALVKGLVKRLMLRDAIIDSTLYLDRRRREEAKSAGLDAYEYLLSVVEFDGFDALKKEFTSQVALNTMTEEKVDFIVKALDAAQVSFGRLMSFFPAADNDEAQFLYHTYYEPLEERERKGQ